MARPVAIGAGVLVVLAVVVIVSVLRPAEGRTEGPVILLGDDWNSYPTAQVRGRLTQADDCLLVGGTVVFWPRGTTWDEERQAVEFGGDFDVAPAAVVGEEFAGGGGHYSLANVEGLEGLDADAVERCIEATGSDGALIAYPGD